MTLSAASRFPGEEPYAQGFFGAVLFLAVDHDGGLAPRAAALLAADFFDFLRQQGYRVHAATSGWAARAFLEKRLPDLTQAAVIMLPSRLYAQSILRVFRRICALRGRTRRFARRMRSLIASVRLCRTI